MADIDELFGGFDESETLNPVVVAEQNGYRQLNWLFLMFAIKFTWFY